MPAATTRNGAGTLAHILSHLEKAQIQCNCGAAHEIREALNQIPRLQEEIDGLKQSLEERKLIERAKGILMRRANMTEQQSYNRLQSKSSTSHLKMVEIAIKLIAAEEIMSNDGEG